LVGLQIFPTIEASLGLLKTGRIIYFIFTIDTMGKTAPVKKKGGELQKHALSASSIDNK